jgi:MoaA/NifB/PqqE/SkfB family radical SAM enzyme
MVGLLDKMLSGWRHGSNSVCDEVPPRPVAAAEASANFDCFVHDAYWHYHQRYQEHDFPRHHLGFRLNQRPNDVSRHVLALDRFLRTTQFRGGSIDTHERLEILDAIDKRFHSDRIPLILSAETLLDEGRPWDALDIMMRAIEYDSYCEVSIGVLLHVLRRLPCAAYWRGFFDRLESPSIGDLPHSDSTTELLDYLVEFCRAVAACEALEDAANCNAVRSFYHRWWKVYRHADSRIGQFAAYGNSDQSRPTGALRHVIEFVSYRRLARRGGHVEESGTEWQKTRCDLALALEQQNSDPHLLLLSADYLGMTDRLDEARDRGYRAFNTNSRCLLTQHVLDCVEHALEQRSRKIPYTFSLLEETPRRFAGKFCPVPFDDAYINPDGDTFLCCSTILPVPVGNVFKENSWNDVWNSKVAQEVRGSILDGTYKYCNRRSCPAILNNALMSSEDLLAERTSSFRTERWRDALLTQNVQVKGALFADLGYDISCNLSCPQCRLDLIVSDKAGFAKLDALREGMIDDLLSKLQYVRISSGGEALFSKHFRKLLGDMDPTRCPSLTHLELLTNGMLFDRRQWDTFQNLHYLKIMLVVSIDASSKATFESIRRNGRWERMLTNLDFASALRSDQKLAKFKISYAVQIENFRDMPDAVRMAERLRVDELSFFKLENVGTYSESEYRFRNIVEPSHPLHDEFLEVLRDPVFASEVVSAHNLTPFF